MHYPELRISPDVLHEYEQQSGHGRAREWLEQRLVEMIEGGTFWLTELMGQREGLYQAVNDIIFGHGVDPGGLWAMDQWQQTTHVPVPPEIADHRVTIVSVDREESKELCVPAGRVSISYRDGMQRKRHLVGGRSRKRPHQTQYEDRVVDLGVTYAELPLRTAWLVLKQGGAYCRIAPHVDDQHSLWAYAEVPPQARLEESGIGGWISKQVKGAREQPRKGKAA